MVMERKLMFLIGCPLSLSVTKLQLHYPRVSPSDHPLTKKPEDSGYEIDYIEKI